MKTIALLSAVTLAGAALFAAWMTYDDWQSAEAGNYVPDLNRGANIYAEACAACHGADLEGQSDWRTPGPDGKLPAPPHDATGHTWHHADRVLFEITKYGTEAVVGGDYESDMPGFGDIYSDEELRDILEWIKTQWPERERSHQARVTAQDDAIR